MLTVHGAKEAENEFYGLSREFYEKLLLGREP